MMSISYNNQDVRLRNRASAQDDIRAAVHDNMWKVIKQVAQVSDKYSEDFKEIYPELISGRYKSGGGLMKWVQEHNPEFDTSLYQRLIDAIEAERAKFFTAQKELRVIKQEHDDLVGTFPGSFFVRNQEPIKVKMITSTHTENVINSGTDDNVNVFDD